jgi:flagellar protein FlaJ
MWYNYLPLAVAVALAGVVALAQVSERVGRVVSRVSLAAFGAYVRGDESDRTHQKWVLRASHADTTYSVYAAETYLYAGVAALVGSIAGVYVVWATFAALGVPAETVRAVLPESAAFLADLLVVPTLSPGELFALLVASNATVGVLAGLATYQLRWLLPEYRANERQRRIDESMERMVAFVYALSRSGMAFPEILRILSRNQGVYGEAAAEMSVAVRDIDLFGTNVLAALERVARRSPSDAFEEFAENLVSVLRSGRSVSEFLHDQYEYYKEEAEAHQAQFLDLLATAAEAYVTVLVAGPLFLITILVIVGLLLGGTLNFLRVFVYALIPLATFGFVVFVDSLTEDVELESRERDAFDATPTPSDASRADGGTVEDGTAVADPTSEDANLARLDAYDRVRGVRRRLEDPVGTVAEQPTALLYVTVPLALAYVASRAWGFYAADALSVRAVDDLLVHATLFVVGTFAVIYEIHNRRIERVEAAVPDFLDRLASVNEAGMPIAESLGRVAATELDALDDELDRIWTDVQWGGNVESALYRFERRVNTPAITRVVTLVTNAMRASGDLGPVLRIAADQAQAARRLKRERRQELFTYLVVIYLSFFVFVAIIAALSLVFLPSVPTADELPASASGTFASVTEADKAAYELLFVHTAIIQAVCSGFVAGQMGEDDVKAGAKHVTVMLLAAYALTLVV